MVYGFKDGHFTFTFQKSDSESTSYELSISGKNKKGVRRNKNGSYTCTTDLEVFRPRYSIGTPIRYGSRPGVF